MLNKKNKFASSSDNLVKKSAAKNYISDHKANQKSSLSCISKVIQKNLFKKREADADVVVTLHLIHIFIDYDYDFYGFSDYRGGYNETFYDEYYRSFDGDQYPSYPSYDYPQSGSNATGGGQRPGRQNSVGF